MIKQILEGKDVRTLLCEEELPQPTKEMEEFYLKRTKEHIDRVKDNMMLMVGYHGLTKDEIESKATNHDAIKYSDFAYKPYIWLTWYYKEKDNGFKYPPGVGEVVRNVAKSHVETQLHHPEAHSDINSMSKLDVVEMICDWMSMSDEKGTSIYDWYKKTVGTKWKFNKEMSEFILKTIDELSARRKK